MDRCRTTHLSRRGFLGSLTLAGMAGLIGLTLKSAPADPAPETKSIALVYDDYATIPESLVKCAVCGEYRGTAKMKELNRGSLLEEEQSDDIVTFSCLCQGILCPRCKRNRIHRPISNTYSPETNSMMHYPYFSGMMGCAECRRGG